MPALPEDRVPGMTDQAIEDLKRMARDTRPANLDRDPLLRERETTHGDFRQTAHMSQQLKMLFRKFAGHKASLDPRHAEVLDMIAVKLARLFAGDMSYDDTWRDIAGYAKLGEEASHHG